MAICARKLHLAIANHTRQYQAARNISQIAKPSDVVFNKKQRVSNLDRSASSADAHVYDYVKDHVAKEVCDRINDLTSDLKRTVFNLGSCSGIVAKNIDCNRVDTFIEADISRHGIRRSKRLTSILPVKFPIEHIQCDEERIPLRKNSVDLVISCLDLHWVNDLVGCFKQIRGILKDDSPFIGCMLGGETLTELRSAIQLAETERLSGFSMHVSPRITGQDLGRVLQGCGFKMITIDVTDLKVGYPSIFELMFDLQGMGENNASVLGSKHLHRDVLQSAAAIYQHMYGDEDSEKGVPATFQIFHFIAWKNPTKATPLKSQ